MNGPGLLALQLLDNDLDHISALERRLPERATLDVAAAAHRAWLADRSRATGLIDAATATIVGAEQQSAALDVKRGRLEAQLKTIIAPREAEALMHEIATINAARGELDDVELAAMEEQAQAESAIAALDEQEPALVATIDAAQAELDVALARIAADRQSLVDRRAEADAALDDTDRAAYRSMGERFDGVGIVQLEGRMCTGCHLDLSAGEFDTVKFAPADVLPECPHCGRLIVR